MIFGLGNMQKMKENMSLSNLGTVALHAAKVPTNVFSSTLICTSTLDYRGWAMFVEVCICSVLLYATLCPF